jgi:hypothetical protein
MKVNHSIELEDGTYKYQGTITGKELDFLVEYAINNLVVQGAFPFVHGDTMDEAAFPVPESPVEQ